MRKKIKGRVIRGKGIGRKLLGFPTANIFLDRAEAKVEAGIYSGRVLINGIKYRAALFVPEKKDLLEAHILDFEADIYGQEIEVLIGEKIRKSRKFESAEELSRQIKKDVEKIRSLKMQPRKMDIDFS